MLRCHGTDHLSIRKPIVPARSPPLDPSTDEGIRSRTGTAGKPFSCSMEEEDREQHRASPTAGIVLRSSRGRKHRRCTTNLFFRSELVKYGPAPQVDYIVFPTRDQNGTKRPTSTEKGNPAKTGFPFGFFMVPKAGFEPARVSPPPPQDGVSASSTTSARCRKNILIHATAENQGEESGRGVEEATRCHKVFLFKTSASLYSFPENTFPCGGSSWDRMKRRAAADCTGTR